MERRVEHGGYVVVLPLLDDGRVPLHDRDDGLREAYLWPINADEQGTPQQVRRVIDLVRKNKIPVVFSESTISDRAALLACSS